MLLLYMNNQFLMVDHRVTVPGREPSIKYWLIYEILANQFKSIYLTNDAAVTQRYSTPSRALPYSLFGFQEYHQLIYYDYVYTVV